MRVAQCSGVILSPIARFMGPTWGPSGADRTQVGPMLSHEICYLGCVQYIPWNTQCLDFALFSCDYIIIQWRFTHIVQGCLTGNQAMDNFGATEVTLRYMGKINCVETKTFQYHIICVIVRSHKITKVWDVASSKCCEIWKKSWVTLLSCGLPN